MLHFGTLNEPENHQALHLWIRCIDRPDNAFLAAFQCGECEAVESRDVL